MTQPHLVGLDLDGTLVRWDIDPAANPPVTPVVTERVRAAVAAATARGHVLVIATGRPPEAVLAAAADTGLTHGYAVTSNGCAVVELDAAQPDTYRLVTATTFLPDDVLRALREAEPEADLGIAVLGDGFHITGGRIFAQLKIAVRNVEFDDLLGIDVIGVVLKKDGPLNPGTLELLDRLGFAGRITTMGPATWVDVVGKTTSKASALEALRVRLGIAPEHTVAVGDGDNDVEMLTWAARGVAMGQADDAIKAAADEVTASADDDGAALVLEGLP